MAVLLTSTVSGSHNGKSVSFNVSFPNVSPSDASQAVYAHLFPGKLLSSRRNDWAFQSINNGRYSLRLWDGKGELIADLILSKPVKAAIPLPPVSATVLETRKRNMRRIRVEAARDGRLGNSYAKRFDYAAESGRFYEYCYAYKAAKDSGFRKFAAKEQEMKAADISAKAESVLAETESMIDIETALYIIPSTVKAEQATDSIVIRRDSDNAAIAEISVNDGRVSEKELKAALDVARECRLIADNQLRVYRVACNHVSANYRRSDERVSVKTNNNGATWYASMAGFGCSKDYYKPEAAIRGLLNDNGCTDILITAESFEIETAADRQAKEKAESVLAEMESVVRDGIKGRVLNISVYPGIVDGTFEYYDDSFNIMERDATLKLLADRLACLDMHERHMLKPEYQVDFLESADLVSLPSGQAVELFPGCVAMSLGSPDDVPAMVSMIESTVGAIETSPYGGNAPYSPPAESFIVVYRPHNMLNIDTKFYGPFDSHESAYGFLCEIPALGTYEYGEETDVPNPGVKYIQTLNRPIVR